MTSLTLESSSQNSCTGSALPSSFGSGSGWVTCHAASGGPVGGCVAGSDAVATPTAPSAPQLRAAPAGPGAGCWGARRGDRSASWDSLRARWGPARRRPGRKRGSERGQDAGTGNSTRELPRASRVRPWACCGAGRRPCALDGLPEPPRTRPRSSRSVRGRPLGLRHSSVTKSRSRCVRGVTALPAGPARLRQSVAPCRARFQLHRGSVRLRPRTLPPQVPSEGTCTRGGAAAAGTKHRK